MEIYFQYNNENYPTSYHDNNNEVLQSLHGLAEEDLIHQYLKPIYIYFINTIKH